SPESFRVAFSSRSRSRPSLSNINPTGAGEVAPFQTFRELQCFHGRLGALRREPWLGARTIQRAVAVFRPLEFGIISRRALGRGRRTASQELVERPSAALHGGEHRSKRVGRKPGDRSVHRLAGPSSLL